MAKKKVGKPSNVELTNAALGEAEDLLEQTIQQQAMEHVPAALRTLARLSKGLQVNRVKPTPSVVRSSARDIVEFAGGRPETRDPRIGDGAKSLTIVLQRFGDGTTRTITGEKAVEGELLDPLAEAESIVSSVSRTFEVPDGPTDSREDT